MTTLKTIAQVDVEIAELQKKRETLLAEAAEFSKLTVPQQLAITIHENTCNGNHVDDCGWHYETEFNHKTKVKTHLWDRDSHKRYLARAERVIKLAEAVQPGISKAPDFIPLAEAFLDRGY